MIAWQETVTEHDTWLRSWLSAKLLPSDPIDDIVQDTLQSAINQGRPEEPLHDVKGWLAGIARNKVRQHIDCRTRERRLQDTMTGEELTGSPAPAPDQFLLDRERLHHVKAALASMKPENATLLRQKYFHNWSYARIAQEMNWSEHTVTNRLRQARQELRTEIQKSYPSSS